MVHHTHRRKVLSFGEKRDVPGAWQELAKLNRANDPVWVNSTIQQFNQERFDPTNQTVQQYVDILQNYASQLEGSSRPITDDNIKERLYGALPKGIGSDIWQTSLAFCLRDNLDLYAAITKLRSCERITQPTTANTANTASANSTRGYRGRGGRGGRGGQSGRGGRGGYYGD